MSRLSSFVVGLHQGVSEPVFIIISIVVIGIGVWLIPKATDIATDSAAGLAGEILGPQQRTLVINSTTNLPELCLMLVSLLGLGRLGGIATPLGSNLANIYLMFLVAPAFLVIKWSIFGHRHKITSLRKLAWKEKGLVTWHLLMSFLMFAFATATYWVLTGTFQFVRFPEQTSLPTNKFWLLAGSIVCLIGIAIFFYLENKLKKKRPEVFEDLDDDEFEASWSQFFTGAISLVLLCYILNEFFVAWTSIYDDQFAGYALFAALHFFVGSLISSLPEITVAIENYEKITPPELNTALASASQSNMTNLAIAGLGCALAVVLLLANIIEGVI